MATDRCDPAAKRSRLNGSSGPSLPVLSRDEYLSKLEAVVKPMVDIRAMYSSLVNGIITDKALMSIPIHDHAIVRGHAVFDTCTVARGALYRVDIHLDRHLESAEKARIPFPFGVTKQENKDRMRSIIAQTVVASGLRDASVRYYMSAGAGNFGVTPDGCIPGWYVVVFTGSVVDTGDEMKGISEFTVDVPLKPSFLATLKSNNYMLNTLTSMASKDKGGSFGILVDEKGLIAESCVMNVAFVTKDRRLITPRFAHILNGTTVRKAMALAEKLVADGRLCQVSQEDIPVATARECVEMMLFSGDSHVKAITKWDGRAVGSGEVGDVAKSLEKLILEDMMSGTGDHYELEYPSA